MNFVTMVTAVIIHCNTIFLHGHNTYQEIDFKSVMGPHVTL